MRNKFLKIRKYVLRLDSIVGIEVTGTNESLVHVQGLESNDFIIINGAETKKLLAFIESFEAIEKIE